jgi:hypothetical protein
MEKSKITTATVFELPQKLGIIQYVEYVPEKRCADGGCLYEGILTAEGCRRGVCIKYKVSVHYRNGDWEPAKLRRNKLELGGCLRHQAAADALWELSSRYEVGIWYEYRRRCAVFTYLCPDNDLVMEDCGLVVNGIRLRTPYCRSVEDCIRRILEDYKREVEKMKEPPAVSSYNPAEELLRRWPELEAFGVEWVRAWAPHAREELVEIAKVMRRFPWMVEVVRQRPVSNPHPYLVEVYVARDGSEACLSLNQLKTFCARNGAVKEVKLELEFRRYEVYEDKIRGVYRPKGLLAFAAGAGEYVKIL